MVWVDINKMTEDKKGFVDSRDNYRYIYHSDSLTKDDLDNLIFEFIFNRFDATTEELVDQYIVIKTNSEAEDIYNNWTDLKDAYELVIADLGITVELPDSMNWELFD